MKTKTCILAMLLAVGLSNSQAQDSWTQKADFGGGVRGGAVGFSIGSKGYVGTGGNDTESLFKDFWEFDPIANTWTQKADFGGTARVGAASFSIGSKGYIGTGSHAPNAFRKDFWEYDPTTNTWTQKADFGGDSRSTAIGFSIGAKGYIGTGINGGCCPLIYLKDVWEYDPTTNTWTQKADCGGGLRGGAVGFTIGSKGYIGTGGDGNIAYKDFWEFDPIANTWTQKADFGGTARSEAAGFSIGSKGYIGTGYDGTFLNDFWEYDSTANSWTQKANFGGTERYDIIFGFSISGKGYTGTGFSQNGYQKDFWEYTPATAQASWIELAPTGGPPSPRAIYVAVYDPATNRMTIHGGTDGTNALSDAWVLSNADGTESSSPTWTKLLPANPLQRFGHSAVYDSSSNRMIVFGGFNSGQSFNDVWVLTNANGNGGNPERLQLTPSGGPPAVRQDHTAVYDSASNRMTIFGGYSGSVCFGDVWVLTSANGMETTRPSWIQLFPSGTQIPVRNGHTAVHDANSNRMIVFSGGCDVTLFNDVWVLTNANGLGGDPEWVGLVPNGTPPSPRYIPAAVYDPTTNRNGCLRRDRLLRHFQRHVGVDKREWCSR